LHGIICVLKIITVSLHVHETIDPRTIVEAVGRRNGNGLRLNSSGL
jgi:hypothetical protein